MHGIEDYIFPEMAHGSLWGDFWPYLSLGFQGPITGRTRRIRQHDQARGGNLIELLMQIKREKDVLATRVLDEPLSSATVQAPDDIQTEFHHACCSWGESVTLQAFKNGGNAPAEDRIWSTEDESQVISLHD